MAQGFERIQAKKDGGSTDKTADLFVEVFKKSFKPSTYSNNWQVWANVSQADRTLAIEKGRTQDGEWARLVKLYNRNRRN